MELRNACKSFSGIAAVDDVSFTARTMNLHSLLEKQGFKTSYEEIPGAHYWFLWRDFLGDFGSILFR